VLAGTAEVPFPRFVFFLREGTDALRLRPGQGGGVCVRPVPGAPRQVEKKSFHVHLPGESGHVPEIGDTPPDAGDPLGADLLRPHPQRRGQAGQIGVKEQRSVMEETGGAVPAPIHALGVARDLGAAGEDIVAAVGGRLHAKGGKGGENRPREGGKINALARSGVGDEREIHVSRIVEHGTAAGEPADDGNAVFLRVRQVHLCPGVLIFADDHGGLVAPEHEDVVVTMLQQVFLRGHVVIWIVGLGVDDDAHSLLLK